MEDSDMKTDIAVIKKLILGNGVKGIAQKVDELYERVTELEILMNDKLNESLNEFRNEFAQNILDSKQFRQQAFANKLVALGIVASTIVTVLF